MPSEPERSIEPFGSIRGYDATDGRVAFQISTPVVVLRATNDVFVPLNRYCWSKDSVGGETAPEPIETHIPLLQ